MTDKTSPKEAELLIGDVSEDMSKVAAQIAYWGRLWATAEGEREIIDAQYRAWRAQSAQKILSSSEKLPEWKVKHMIEAHPKFLEFKEAYAEATRNAVMLKAKTDAFKAKASLLQSKGALLRAEFEATGMSTKEEKFKEAAEEAREEKKERLRRVRRKATK